MPVRISDDMKRFVIDTWNCTTASGGDDHRIAVDTDEQDADDRQYPRARADDARVAVGLEDAPVGVLLEELPELEPYACHACAS